MRNNRFVIAVMMVLGAAGSLRAESFGKVMETIGVVAGTALREAALAQERDRAWRERDWERRRREGEHERERRERERRDDRDWDHDRRDRDRGRDGYGRDCGYRGGCDEFIPGDRVHGDYGAGTVQEAFRNGVVRVKFDAYMSWETRNASQLGRGISCMEGACARDRVLGDYGTGEALEIFTDGFAKVKFDAYVSYEYRRISSLGVRVNCLRGICSGDRVWGDYGSGTALEVFDNGYARVKFDAYVSYETRRVDQLGGGDRRGRY